MKKLPLGIQSFRKIIEGGYVYVDKTQYIYNLINNASYIFLSRPRRFGKSLLLDTIGEVFSGDRELFKGLWIYASDYGFAKHPVIRLDMSGISAENPDALKRSLASALRKRIEDENLYESHSESLGERLGENLDIADEIPSDMFKRLIEALCKKHGQRVVVLIDEYDKPILDHIDNFEVADANRQVIKGFYGILKSMDPYLRSTFITGVSKFTKTSLFSELNNFFDITLTEEYSNICGVAIEELGEYFGEHIVSLSALESFKQYGNLRDEILAWYDGYSWDGKTRAINPFSLISFFMQKRFAGYWFASGSPKFLIDLIKKKPGDYTNLTNMELSEYMLDMAELGKIAVEPMLFQAGYLTVKETIQTRGSPAYRVGMPNFEVREAFNLNVVSALTENDEVRTGRMRLDIDRALQAGDLQRMLEALRSFFASIPYNLHIEQEAYYHSVFYAMMSALGFDMDVEVSVSKGRIDAALELGDKAYVMEFKYKKCPPGASAAEKQKLSKEALDEAMRQIGDRGYSAKYKGSGKDVYQAAFAFLGRGDIEMRVERIEP